MNVNLSTADRVIRFLLFVVAMGLFLLEIIDGWLAYTLVIAGTVLLLTSLMSFCPIYRILGIKTYRKVNKEHE